MTGKKGKASEVCKTCLDSKSLVWHLFNKIENDPTKALCVRCQSSYSTGGGTSNLLKHVRKIHKKTYELLLTVGCGKEGGAGRRRQERDSSPNEVTDDSDVEDVPRKRRKRIESETDDNEPTTNEEVCLAQPTNSIAPAGEIITIEVVNQLIAPAEILPVEEADAAELNSDAAALVVLDMESGPGLPSIDLSEKSKAEQVKRSNREFSKNFAYYKEAEKKREKHQLTLDQISARKESYQAGGSRHKTISLSLLFGQSNGILSADFFTHPKMPTFMKLLCPSYTPIKESEACKMAQDMSKIYKGYFDSALENIKYLSLGIDVENLLHCANARVTIFFIIPGADAELNVLPVAQRTISNANLPRYLLSHLHSVLESFGLESPEKHIKFVIMNSDKDIYNVVNGSTDEALLLADVIRSLKGELTNIVSDAIVEVQRVGEIFEQCSELIQFVQSSKQVLDALKEEVSKNGVDEITKQYVNDLESSDPTEFTQYSAFSSLSGILAKVFTDIGDADSPALFSIGDNNSLRESVALLLPVQQILLQIRNSNGNNNLLISAYLPMVTALWIGIKNTEVKSKLAIDLKANLCSKVEELKHKLLRKKNVVKAMVLDLRFKQRILEPLAYASVRQELSKELANLAVAEKVQVAATSADEVPTSSCTNLFQNLGSPEFWQQHAMLLQNESACPPPLQQADQSSSTPVELGNYLNKRPSPGSSTSPRDFWRKKQEETFKVSGETDQLANMALEYLSCFSSLEVRDHRNSDSSCTSSSAWFQKRAISALPEALWFDVKRQK